MLLSLSISSARRSAPNSSVCGPEDGGFATRLCNSQAIKAKGLLASKSNEAINTEQPTTLTDTELQTTAPAACRDARLKPRSCCCGSAGRLCRAHSDPLCTTCPAARAPSRARSRPAPTPHWAPQASVRLRTRTLGCPKLAACLRHPRASSQPHTRPLPHGITRGGISAGLPAPFPAPRPAPCPPGPARTSCPLLARPPLLPATAASASATPTAAATPTPQAALRQSKTTTALREYQHDTT